MRQLRSESAAVRQPIVDVETDVDTVERRNSAFRPVDAGGGGSSGSDDRSSRSSRRGDSIGRKISSTRRRSVSKSEGHQSRRRADACSPPVGLLAYRLVPVTHRELLRGNGV